MEDNIPVTQRSYDIRAAEERIAANKRTKSRHSSDWRDMPNQENKKNEED